MPRTFLKSILLSILFLISNCITIQVPPITVTGTKTASEKQIIGQERELEKDVWMISSAKTASRVDLDVESEKVKTGKDQDVNTVTFKGFAIIDAFSSEFAELKKDGVVGENQDGLISNLLNVPGIVLSDEVKSKYNRENEDSSYKVLVETVKQMNLARKYIIEGYILDQKSVNPDFNPDPEELLKIQKEQYHDSLQTGEYLQGDDGTWSQKK